MTPRLSIQVMALVVATLASRTAFACSSDSECRGDRICVAGQCADSTAGRADAAPIERSALGAAPGARGSFYVNALGVVEFGLTPTIEVGSKLAVNAHLLLFNTGVLSYLIADTDTLHFSIGGGPGLRYYFGSNGNLRGLYVGGSANYIAWEEQYKEDTLFKTKYVAVLGEAGYRWVFGNGFTLGVGATAGPAIVLDRTSEVVHATYYEANDASNMFVGFLAVDVGFMFGR